jgi:hypothetical protein
MLDLVFRTEDIRIEDMNKYFVETKIDREIINLLKTQTPAILVGSRGVGKSFLLRIAQSELIDSFERERILPVYVSFIKSGLLQTNQENQFQFWMLAKVCQEIIRSLKKQGLMVNVSQQHREVLGVDSNDAFADLIKNFESSWHTKNFSPDLSCLPSIEDFKYTIEDICEELNISRINLFFDEAIHVFLPEQQRQFFTLFRDLRTPYITCNAAVYPGITSFGDTFQSTHDATVVNISRDIFDNEYVASMKEIIEKQAQQKNDSTILTNISKYMDNFKILAFSANGNPRMLLKILAESKNISSGNVSDVIKKFFRTSIWKDFMSLADLYTGHRAFFDWGREFIDDVVLPDFLEKNQQGLSKGEGETRCCIWVHRKAPEQVKIALRLLDYIGIVSEHTTGIKATRSEFGTRYLVNPGCIFSLLNNPSTEAPSIIRAFSLKRMSEYGANHSSYMKILTESNTIRNPDPASILSKRIKQKVELLDLSPWMKNQLTTHGITTIEQILKLTEKELKLIPYFGEARARQIMNAAINATNEYISG